MAAESVRMNAGSGRDFRDKRTEENVKGNCRRIAKCMGRDVADLMDFSVFLLLSLAVLAVLCDLNTGRIPNGIIAVGLSCGALYQLYTSGPTGVVLYLGGAALPILFFSLFYYFRMIGAGDIKLLCMAGGYFGLAGSFACITWSILFGAFFSLLYMLRRGNLEQRILYFARYVSHYSKNHQWESYMGGVGEDAKFCFSVPILLGILWQIGGSI